VSLNRLEAVADLSTPQGRGQLDESLILMADAIKRLRADVEKVKDADKIVRPVPITAYPMAAGQVYTGQESGEIGDISWRAVQETPVSMLPCDGSAVSRSTYSDLFSKIGTTYGSGDGINTFNVPNLRRRTLVGVGGTHTSTLANTIGATGGSETHTLTVAELASHAHTVDAHTHDISHTHEVDLWTGSATSGVKAAGLPNAQTDIANVSTGAASTSSSGSASPGVSNSGGGGAHNNMQPSIVMAPYIRYRLGPTDTIQTLPISWGGVNGQWRLDTLKNFPVTNHENLHTVVVTGDRPGAVVRITATGGTQSGSSSENKIVGIVALPYNFKKFKTEAIKLYTKMNITGASGSATVTLRVSDPVTAGAYLSNTYSRTVNASGSTIADSAYVECLLTKEDLGRDWKSGYLLRWELLWAVPKTFTTAQLDVGYLEIGWQ
jgi:microcystin-dependent protein